MYAIICVHGPCWRCPSKEACGFLSNHAHRHLRLFDDENDQQTPHKQQIPQGSWLSRNYPNTNLKFKNKDKNAHALPKQSRVVWAKI